MKAVEILVNLIPYQNLLNEIYLKERNEKALFCKQLKSQYNFITLEIKSKSKEEEKAIVQTEIKVTFEIKRGAVILANLYLADATKNDWIEKRVITDKSLHDVKWDTAPECHNKYDKELVDYFEISDRIAAMGSNCSSGDNYYPGYYSEISVTDKVIRLSQVNFYNSRSIDHKKDYHMRELNCIIDLNDELTSKEEFDSEKIGKLIINFSDRSSENNRVCGEAIAAKIKEEKERYNKLL